MRSTAAFTVLELLISIAMLGLLAGIALPNFTALIHRQQLNQAASQLADAVREAKTLALTKNMALKFVVSSGLSATYCITTDDCTSGLIKSDRLPDRIYVTPYDGFESIPFDTYGIVRDSLSITGTVVPHATLNYPDDSEEEGVTRTVFLTSKLGKLVIQ